jgi:hypothetical protein
MKEVADLLHVTPRPEDEPPSWHSMPSIMECSKSADSVRANTVSFDSIGDFQQRLYMAS